VLIGFVAFHLVHRRHLQREQTRKAKVIDEISGQQTDDLALGVELPERTKWRCQGNPAEMAKAEVGMA